MVFTGNKTHNINILISLSLSRAFLKTDNIVFFFLEVVAPDLTVGSRAHQSKVGRNLPGHLIAICASFF